MAAMLGLENLESFGMPAFLIVHMVEHSGSMRPFMVYMKFTWFPYRVSISNCSKAQNFFSTCIKTLTDNPISDPVRQAGQRTIRQ